MKGIIMKSTAVMAIEAFVNSVFSIFSTCLVDKLL